MSDWKKEKSTDTNNHEQQELKSEVSPTNQTDRSYSGSIKMIPQPLDETTREED